MATISEIDNDIKKLLQNQNIQLLAEIIEGEHQYHELKTFLTQYRERMSRERRGFAWGDVAVNMPYATSLFLILHGVYGYTTESGFWRTLDIPNTQQQEISKKFQDTLKQFGLPTFKSVVRNDNALTHITPILLHAGIPRACMDDYFRYFLLRYMRRVHRYISLDEYCDHWLEQPWPMVAESVKRFIKYGGSFARDWIERTAEMGAILLEYDRTHRQVTEYPAHLTSQIRVADWVAKIFWELLLTRRTRSVRMQADDDVVEYSRPQVYLNEDYRVLLELPQQVVRPEPNKSLIWHISTGNSAYEIMPIVRSLGRYMQVDTRHELLSDVADLFRLTISLQYGETVLCQWSFLREAYVFRQYNTMNRLMSHDAQMGQIQLPNQPVWLLTNKQHDIQADNTLIRGKQCSNTAWLYQLDIPIINSLTVDGKPLQIQEDDDQLHARLVGGQQLPLVQEEGMTPVYAVSPHILLPWSRNLNKRAQLDDWYLTITHQTSGQTVIARKNVASLSGVIQSHDGIDIDIAKNVADALLPGQYHITVRSQSGRVFMPQLHMVYVPGLQLTSRIPVILPEAVTHSHSEQPVVHDIQVSAVPDDWTIVGATHDVSGSTWRCPVTTDNHRVTMTFVHRQNVQQQFDVQFTIPRLDIGYRHQRDHIVATNSSLSHDMNWYEDVQPRIEMQLSPESLSTIRTFTLSVEVEFESMQGQPMKLNANTDAKRLWFLFDTRQIVDSIRNAPSNVNVRLVIHCDGGSKISYDLLTLQKPVKIIDMHIEIKPVTDRWRVAARWQAPQSHASWKYVIWSVTKPWQEPIVYDVVHGMLSQSPIIESGRLFPGYMYAVGFMSVGGDKHRIPLYPPLNAPGIQAFRFSGSLTTSHIQSVIDQIIYSMHGGSKAITRDELTFERVRIQELTKLLLFLYGVCVYMAGTSADFAAILRDYVLPKIIHVKPIELLIATLRVRDRVKRADNTDYALFERMMHDIHIDASDLLIKTEISQVLWDSQIAFYLQRPLESADYALLRRFDVAYQLADQEPFFASITHSPQVVNMPSEFANVPFALDIAYENVLMVAGTYADDAHAWKRVRVTEFRKLLMPTFLLWLANEYYAKHHANDVRLWADSAVIPTLYRHLDAYTIDMGDLRDYLLNAYEQGFLYTPTNSVRKTRTRKA